MRREQVAALDTLNSQLAQKELEVRQLPKSPISASLPLILCRQLAESRARLSDTTAAEEASQAGVDTATADVAAERESSALNARRGVANDALRVEADGALQRAEAAKDVRAMARSPQPTGSTNSRCTQELEAQTNLLLAAKSEHEECARPLAALTAPAD